MFEKVTGRMVKDVNVIYRMHETILILEVCNVIFRTLKYQYLIKVVLIFYGGIVILGLGDYYLVH